MKILSSALKVAFGLVISQSILAVFLPISTRLYSADDFALFGYLFSSASLLIPFLFLRMESFIPRESNFIIRNKYFPALSYFSLYSFPCVFFIALAFIIIFPPNEDITFLGSVFFSFLVVVSAYTFSIFNMAIIILVRDRKFKELNKIRVVRSLLIVFIQLILSKVNIVSSLFLGEALGRLLAFFKIIKKSKVKLRPSKRSFNYFYTRNKKDIAINFPSSIASSFTLNVFSILLISLYSGDKTGVFFLIYKLIGAPIGLITQSLAISSLGDVSLYLREKRYSGIYQSITKTTLLLSCMAVFIFSLIYFALDNYEEIIFGGDWVQTSYIYLCIIPCFIGQVVFSPFSQLMIIMGKVKFQFFWEFTRLFGVLISIFLPYYYFNEKGIGFEYTIITYSIFMLFMYTIHYFLTLVTIKRLIRA